MQDSETNEGTEVAEAPAPTLDQVVLKYIALRDKKAEHKKAYDAKIEAIDAGLEKLEAFIKASLEQLGVESVRTSAGTAYQSTRTSATAADWPMVLEWIRANEHWDMLEKRVNKSFVESYRNEFEDLPPGVNWREERVINIRRS